jgi:hypothetical protein
MNSLAFGCHNDPRVDPRAATANSAGREPDIGVGDAAGAFLRLGMMHMTGHAVPIDLVAAHKWFNLAAMHGNEDAIRLRREIAAEMSQSEIAAAQRAARDWQAQRASERKWPADIESAASRQSRSGCEANQGGT